MKKKNIWKNVESPLEMHTDDRGSITDIFYNSKIDHVAVISSEPNSIRGNHYHKETTQHILVTHGSLEYWYKPVFSELNASKIIANKGDLISTPPNEIHALKIGDEGNEFIVFSEGIRGGKDYESDTFRVPNIIIEE
jgi:dTDP-4-dehydrorhamnose 3,5-epimerase-like enzyme